MGKRNASGRNSPSLPWTISGCNLSAVTGVRQHFLVSRSFPFIVCTLQVLYVETEFRVTCRSWEIDIELFTSSPKEYFCSPWFLFLHHSRGSFWIVSDARRSPIFELEQVPQMKSWCWKVTQKIPLTAELT